MLVFSELSMFLIECRRFGTITGSTFNAGRSPFDYYVRSQNEHMTSINSDQLYSKKIIHHIIENFEEAILIKK